MTPLYLEVNFEISAEFSDVIIAELDQHGYDSFQETETGVQAYILIDDFDEEIIKDLQQQYEDIFELVYSVAELENKNWNEEWEKNFSPIQVDDQCSVRAPFHPQPEVEYDIVIEPKMSFGTGHHATTHMMIQHILKNSWEGKNVLDMGCGTGVLAILVAMKGAKAIDAIDIDNWCYLNTLENIERNNCEHINVEEGGAELLEGKFYDVIIANINRNILLEDIPVYTKSLKPNGELFLSGFYKEDIPVIERKCGEHGLSYVENFERNNWVAVKFAL